MSSIQADEIKNYVPESLAGKTLLITGATGLIGSTIVNRLLLYNEERNLGIRIIALVRDEKRAKEQFKGLSSDKLQFLTGNITQKIHVNESVDYIIHAASQTASKAFVEQPVETIRTALDGTINMLELAREKQVKGFVYLSSMEVYGSPSTDEKIGEEHGTNLNTMSIRTSYPEGKRMCECLCTSYWAEYGIPAKVIRLTQTFGPGVKYDDSRVFAEFARCAIEKRDIVLHTKGNTKRCYLYTGDAATAILTVLLRGKPGEAYNAANESTYCSIYEMAQLVAKECADGQIRVIIQEDDEGKYGYAPVLRMNLDASKLRELGWEATKNLTEMFCALCDGMKQ